MPAAQTINAVFTGRILGRILVDHGQDVLGESICSHDGVVCAPEYFRRCHSSDC